MIGQPLHCRSEESSLIEVGLPFSPAEPRGIVLFCLKLTSYITASFLPAGHLVLHFNMSIWVDATGQASEKKKRKRTQTN